MDGMGSGLPGPRGGTVLQRFVTGRVEARRDLYWRDIQAASTLTPGVMCHDGGVLHVAEGATLGFDTYFNTFFESQWIRHTAVRSLVLHMHLAGTALLRVWRHALGRKVIVCERLAGPGPCRIDVGTGTINFRQHGALSVELCGTEGPFAFVDGAWLTEDMPSRRAALAAVFCTFNREAEIARVLASIGEDPAALARLARVYVVNQGSPGLAQSPDFVAAAGLLGSRLSLIQQDNFGGAGGFSRGLLETLADPAVTHAVLLDDDLELEPDSLLRMAAFFSFCKQDIVLGGHMLDLLNPTMLYEAGAVISEREWAFLPQHYMLDVGNAGSLEKLSQPYAIHYNGWWCCGFPLSLLREHGMPLPCFIRGDDMEFGLRLHQRGVPTVPMPGIAVWHEPFYLKLGGWQLFYETRNMLVTAALHQPFGRLGVVRRVGRQIVNHMLTYRYYSTALILQGVRDFLAGPDGMREAPLSRHHSLQGLKQAYPTAFSRREHVAHEQRVLPIPLGRLRCLSLLAWLLVRNAVKPSARSPARHMVIEKLHWLTIRQAEHIAIETWWDAELPTYRRVREHHRTLLWESVGLLIRLARELPTVAQAWREAAPDLTSTLFWRRYLGVSPGIGCDELPAAPTARLQAVAQGRR